MSGQERPMPLLPAGAHVSGLAAVVIARLLLDDPDWLPAALDRLGLVEDQRLRVVATVQAIRRAGELWRDGCADATNPAPVAQLRPSSGGTVTPGPLDSEEVATMLDVSPTYVRRLAVEQGLGRKVAGRWVFDPDTVAQFQQARRAG